MAVTPCSTWQNVKDATWTWGTLKAAGMTWGGLKVYFCQLAFSHKVPARPATHLVLT